jgi:pimeloyl-ACP methyl ester carboxylesterase
MTSTRAPKSAALPIQASDLRGLYRLGVDATVGLVDLVEAMHHTIVSRAGIVGPAPAGRTSGITGVTYRAVRGTTRVLGRGVDAVLGTLAPAADNRAASPKREAVIAALNGLWGDHLADSGNPLAIATSLRVGGRPLDLSGGALAQALPANPGARLLVLAHGLCMNDLQWTRQGHDHGQALERDLGFTPIYLHYNSGRHVSQNGREFAMLLERLVECWPVPVQELVIVGHSMGGLVARSACHHGEQQRQSWLGALTKIVFLGTPHHGAPLERGGRLVDTVFGLSPYVAPFARIGKARSAGITDLRYGNLQDADWNGRDRHAQRRDDRRPTPLPESAQAYLVAATAAQRSGGLRSATIGDGLVPLSSALGRHRDPALALPVPKTHQQVVTSASHWDLLSRDEVYDQLRTWLA